MIRMKKKAEAKTNNSTRSLCLTLIAIKDNKKDRITVKNAGE